MKPCLFKKVLFPIFLFTVTLLSSCKKDSTIDIPSVGKASFKINGELLETEVRAKKRGDKFLMALEKYRMSGGEPSPWEVLSIEYVHNKLDSVQRIYNIDSLGTIAPELVTQVSGFFSSRKFYDVGCEIFEVVESDSINNWIVLDGQRNNFNEVTGRFALHMYKVHGCDAEKYPDTLLITDGQFYFSL
ncbi:hypothetical protein [Owenweeksia hongkongensis]|uniref:hypothetical protein n=1 Tax=Owenweeksia hongkongensis TaxID=253245 RepID=UPI003A9552D4